MAMIMVETELTKQKVKEALETRGAGHAHKTHESRSVSGDAHVTILNEDVKGNDHHILLQINPDDNDKPSGGAMIGFKELAGALYQALDFDRQSRIWSQYDADDEGEEFTPLLTRSGLSFGPLVPVSIMESHRDEAAALVDALESAVKMLRADQPQYNGGRRVNYPPVIDGLETSLPTSMPSSAALPALSSRTYFAGPTEGMTFSEKGTVSAAMLTIAPFAPI